MSIPKIIETLGQAVYGKSPKECIEKGICIECGEEALPKCYSDAGKREFRISGLCERCFDKTFE